MSIEFRYLCGVCGEEIPGSTLLGATAEQLAAHVLDCQGSFFLKD